MSRPIHAPLLYLWKIANPYVELERLYGPWFQGLRSDLSVPPGRLALASGMSADGHEVKYSGIEASQSAGCEFTQKISELCTSVHRQSLASPSNWVEVLLRGP